MPATASLSISYWVAILVRRRDRDGEIHTAFFRSLIVTPEDPLFLAIRARACLPCFAMQTWHLAPNAEIGIAEFLVVRPVSWRVRSLVVTWPPSVNIAFRNDAIGGYESNASLFGVTS